MSKPNPQLQIAEISGGGQIPLDQVRGVGGVTSLDALTGDLLLASGDGSISVTTPISSVVDIRNNGVHSVVAGSGINVDNTDPKHPVVSAPGSGVASVVAGSGIAVDSTDPAHPVVSATAPNPASGPNLTDADVTVNPHTDAASQYTLPAATLTADHVVNLGVAGPPITGTLVTIVRRDLTAHAYTVGNAGANPGTLLTFDPSPAGPQAATFFFNSADWVLVGFQYVSP